MSITLDATLKAAQDGINHRPIVELTSSPMGDIVPVAGNYFNTLSTAEYEPQIISMSTGRLAVILQRSGDLYYLYTPTDRSEWIEVLVTHPYVTNASDPCICELANGNIGIIFVVDQTSLYYKIITPTGTIVTDFTLIESGIAWVGNPYVITLVNDTYLLVYSEGTGTPPDTSKTYYLKQRTSSNFTSWNAATDITPAAFSSTKYCNNPHLTQVASGRIILHLDYMNDYVNLVELNNIYHMTSDDNGSSWSAATKVTDYTTVGLSATHPTTAEKQTGDLTFIYAERSVVKKLDTDMTGYPYTNFRPAWMNFDADNNELHIGNSGWSSGYNELVTIDIDAWEYKNHIDSLSIPPVEGVISPLYKSDCEWDVWKLDGYPNYIQSYNHDSEVSNIYVWGTAPGTNYGRTINYLVNMACGYAAIGIHHGVVVEEDGIQKLYLWIFCSGYGSVDAQLGWIDLNEIADPVTGMYTFNEVMRGLPSVFVHQITLGAVDVRWDKTHEYLIYVSSIDPYYAVSDGLVVINPKTGSIVFEATGNAGWSGYNAGFPVDGLRDAIYMGEDIYMTFPYSSAQPDRRGLACYHSNTGTVTYYEPNWATVNEYNLDNMIDMGDGRILMTSNNTLANGGGVAIFDTNTSSWGIFNDDTFPGFGRTSNAWRDIDYDPVTKTIYAIYGDTIIAFSEYGPYSILQQTDIENVDTTIGYGDYVDFSYNFFEYQCNIVYDSDHVLWLVWQHLEGGTEYSIQWANLIGDFDITDDITLSPISIEWDIEKPAKLSFSLSKGHLYDPQNLLSTLSPFFRKGRKIVVALGERISSTDYLQDQGEFVVKTVSLEYTTDKYPDIKIIAEDLRILWEDHEVIATQYYDDLSPHNTLEHILLHYADLEAGEMDIPATFENTHLLHHQFINMNLDDIIKELLDHFGYFPFVNVDGKFEPRYVNLSKATDHVYSDITQMVRYSPNDSYSTFINRIIVKGISHVYTEVLYEEESITSLSGTTGWWGKKTDEVVWYSDDHHRSCRYPRLEIIQSISEFKIFGIKGGGSESLSSTDPDECYVIITIDAPDLMGILFATMAAILALIWPCLGCSTAFYCGVCIYIITLLTNLCLMILGTIASYNYNIWARPIGHEKKTFQAQSDDDQLQQELGSKVVLTTIDDPMCYTIGSCQVVADQEMEIVMAQRRRLKFKKTAHLQDEVGDVIELKHPYSGEALKILIPYLKRTMTIGKDFVDEIEGWRLLS